MGSFDLTRLCNDLLSRAWRAPILFINELINHLSGSSLIQEVLNLLTGSGGGRLFDRREETHLGVFVLGGLRDNFFDLREDQALLR